MWKWNFEAKAKTSASPERIWETWTDVEHWPNWDHGLEWSSIKGPFATGTKVQLKPKKGPKVTGVILEVIPLESFTDVTHMPFTKVFFHHRLIKEGESWILCHGIEIRGVLTPLLSRTMGRQIAREMPEALHALINLAEGTK
jgi:uncharacterized protein YndB with AHSA1/START domain